MSLPLRLVESAMSSLRQWVVVLVVTWLPCPWQPYSMDDNLFHISFESGVLEDPAATPPDSTHK